MKPRPGRRNESGRTTLGEHRGTLFELRRSTDRAQEAAFATEYHRHINLRVICGAENWVDIEMYGNKKIEWLKRYLELPNGIPSHDT